MLLGIGGDYSEGSGEDDINVGNNHQAVGVYVRFRVSASQARLPRDREQHHEAALVLGLFPQLPLRRFVVDDEERWGDSLLAT